MLVPERGGKHKEGETKGSSCEQFKAHILRLCEFELNSSQGFEMFGAAAQLQNCILHRFKQVTGFLTFAMFGTKYW